MKMKKMMLTAVAIIVAFAAPAFAANPFADVPMNSWAYDAVAQLAAAGIVSGYPDGSFKGAQPATRYELASVVARAMAKIDMEKASKQDVEMLKKLIVEFKDELDALGVKVDKIDARLADVEKGVGKWYFSGNFRFTARWEGNDVINERLYGTDGKSDFALDRFRWNIKKVVDDKVTLMVRLQSGNNGNGSAGEYGVADNFTLHRAYAIVSLPYDITAYIGKQDFDWEGMYVQMDYDGYNYSGTIMTDNDFLNAFRVVKNWGVGEFQVFVAHSEGNGNNFSADDAKDHRFLNLDRRYDKASYDDSYLFGARAAFRFNEQFHFDLNYIGQRFGDSYSPHGINSGAPAVYSQSDYNNDSDTFWFAGRFNFNPNISVVGRYYWQSLDWDYVDDFGSNQDSPKLWNVALDVKQDALKFTSLWIEYGQIDAGFKALGSYNSNPYGQWFNYSFKNFMAGPAGDQYMYDTTFWHIFAGQKWNDQWYTYVRWAKYDRDLSNNVGGNLDNYSVSVRYQYTPALSFELMYDYRDDELMNQTDNIIMFRTNVSF